MAYNTTMVKALFGIKKKDAKDGAKWSELSDDRKYRQHPHGISETDAHAVPKYTSPVYREEVNPVEEDAKMDELQERINSLREKPQAERIDEQLVDDDLPKDENKDKYRNDWTD